MTVQAVRIAPYKYSYLLTYLLNGYPAEVGALFTTVSSIRVSRVRVTLTVMVRVSRVSVVVSVRDSVK